MSKDEKAKSSGGGWSDGFKTLVLYAALAAGVIVGVHYYFANAGTIRTSNEQRIPLVDPSSVTKRF